VQGDDTQVIAIFGEGVKGERFIAPRIDRGADFWRKRNNVLGILNFVFQIALASAMQQATMAITAKVSIAKRPIEFPWQLTQALKILRPVADADLTGRYAGFAICLGKAYFK
jgi:hypothetical protein